MNLVKLKIKNFRGYKEEIVINFCNLTAFVGKNDIGKSTVLEALDIFFNEGKGVVKLDKDDINKQALTENNNEIVISACFEELPTSIVIDSTNKTTLKSEYLLNSNNQLEIIKKYPNAGKENVFVKANHPANTNCNDLLLKTQKELQKIVTDNSIECDDKTKNAEMRKAIWKTYSDDLQLSEREIEVTKNEIKTIWERLKNYLPLYSLFQSDRKNSDGDSEVQDPLKEAVKQILSDTALKTKFNEIATEVKTKLKDVSAKTLEKLREMNPEIANSLNPVIPETESLKWAEVFKTVSIAGDENIPINKRGSGVKRLILLNFFRAEAERRKKEQNIPSIIYAIEEPETSQHTEHQKKLISAFLSLAETENTQVIITTHSAALVKELKFEHLRLITVNGTAKTVQSVLPNQLPYPSLNEVNYLAFTEITEEYHNELYGFIQAKAVDDNAENEKEEGFEKYLVAGNDVAKTKKWIRLKGGVAQPARDVTLPTYIRNFIHHPENKQNTKYTSDELKQSIEIMRKFIQSLKAKKQ
ncbi:MAG: ATP-binding protein [Bacteroidales bacterium]|jgi:predicted ATP-dependent endonuclease of OLD family|nr:ATP-binding protein [Bacteroidales bacterium]